MGHLAKSDGRVSEQEIAAARAIMHSLRLGPDQTRRAIEYYTEGKQPGFDAERAVRELRGALWGQPQLAYFFMEIQLHAAVAGNGLGDVPRQRLRRIATHLGIAAPTTRSSRRWRWRSNARPESERRRAQLAEACVSSRAQRERRAGIKPTAGRCRHHPDKLQANGVPNRCSSTPRSARSRSARPTS
jgi:DnaJ like chaperone protein